MRSSQDDFGQVAFYITFQKRPSLLLPRPPSIAIATPVLGGPGTMRVVLNSS